MKLKELLRSLYEEGDIKIEDDVPSYTATAIGELQAFWRSNNLGYFNIDRIEEKTAYAILRHHHHAITADRDWMDRLSQFRPGAH